RASGFWPWVLLSSWLAAAGLKHAAQGHQHASCRTPDIAIAVGNVVHLVGQLAQGALPGFVIGGVEDELERHFEYIVNLGVGDAQLIIRIHEADRRGHSKARDD